MLSIDAERNEIDAQQTVVFYPTFGRLDEDGDSWRISVRGSVSQREPSNIRRKILVRLLKRVMKLDDSAWDNDIFRQRVGAFLTPGQRGKRIAVRVGSRVHVLQRKSRRSGHFSGTLRLTLDEASELLCSGEMDAGWIAFDCVTAPGENRSFDGRVQLIARRGVSVISDVDDTIKHSEVTRRGALLTNTFLREFTTVPGMPELYRSWADQGAVFHYVSSSPWQLYGALEDLRHAADLPPGTFHLRLIRFRDPSILRLFVARRRGKRRGILSICRAFPHRRFVLVGDSGEKDPEIYGSIARKFPGQIVRIFIRDVRRRPIDAERCRKVFRRLPREVWRVFHHPDEIRNLLPLGK